MCRRRHIDPSVLRGRLHNLLNTIEQTAQALREELEGHHEG